MMTIEEVRIKLSDRNLAEVARRIGVSRAYLSYIAKGVQLPSYEILEKLTRYLEAN